MNITVAMLRRFAGARAKQSILEAIAEHAAEALPKVGINTPLRIQHFMAQLAHESAGFKTTVEYASGAAYEGRKNLGNVQKGDGKRYKGRGLIQLTGRANYRIYGKRLGIDLEGNPDLAAEPGVSLVIACEYWASKNLNTKADRDDLVGITKAINGGTNGLKDREVWLSRARTVFTEAPLAAKPAVPHGQTSAQIKAVQKDLYDLGYVEVGLLDGKWGGKTAGAIAAFKNDRRVEGEAVIDDTLLTELRVAKDVGWTRPIAKARAEASEESIAKAVPEIVPVQKGRLAAAWTAALSFAAAVVNAMADYFQDALAWVVGLKGYAAGMPGWAWWLLAAALAGLMAYFSQNGINSIVDAFRKGARA